MDENLHMVFYRNIVAAALELAPSDTMRAITDEVKNFQMPGNIIPGFLRKSVHDRQGRHLRPAHPPRTRVVMPLLRQRKVFGSEGLNAEGEQALHGDGRGVGTRR